MQQSVAVGIETIIIIIYNYVLNNVTLLTVVFFTYSCLSRVWKEVSVPSLQQAGRARGLRQDQGESNLFLLVEIVIFYQGQGTNSVTI